MRKTKDIRREIEGMTSMTSLLSLLNSPAYQPYARLIDARIRELMGDDFTFVK